MLWVLGVNPRHSLRLKLSAILVLELGISVLSIPRLVLVSTNKISPSTAGPKGLDGDRSSPLPLPFLSLNMPSKSISSLLFINVSFGTVTPVI
jgi:hypothetical protein